MDYPENARFLVLVLSVRDCVLVVLGLLILERLLGGTWEEGIRWVERRSAALAAHKGAAVLLVFASVLLLRICLLPLLPVPVPGAHDEFSYLLAGDTFAHGRLANPTHPLWQSFETFHVLSHPTYASIYPPAQGFALALGEILGGPWIGVLLSVAAMCAAIVWMLQGWLPARFAFLGGILAVLKFGVASYWINSYWGGAMAAVGGALVLGALPRLLKRGRVRNALLLGLGVAILANSRPVEGFLFCIPPALYFFWILSPRPKRLSEGRRLALAGILGAVLLLTLSFVGYYDWRVTGHPLLLPHAFYTRQHATTMFLWNAPSAPKRYANPQLDRFFERERLSYRPTVGEALRVTGDKVTRDSFCFLWGGALLLLPTTVASVRGRKLRLLAMTLLLAATGSFLIVWSFPHYVAALTCVLYAFLIQGVRRLRALPGRGRSRGRLLSRAAVLLLVFASARYAVHHVCDSMGWCRGLVDRQALLDRLRKEPGNHLVLVHYGPAHEVGREWVYNDAEIDGAKVVWARELDPAQTKGLLSYFSNRRVWEVDPDSRPRELIPFR